MNTIRKLIAVLQILCLFFAIAATVNAAGEAVPYYNNVVSARTTAAISNSGLLTVEHSFNGIQGVTLGAEITTYVEKKVLGLFWSRVDIGTDDNAWHITVGSYSYNGIRQCQLSETGTYRVTSTYVISGTGGSPDEITSTTQVTY